MSEKNTHSILESIKKKLNKFDQKPTNKVADVAGEFDYVAPVKKDEMVKETFIAATPATAQPEFHSFPALQPAKEDAAEEKEKSSLEDIDWDDESSVKPIVAEVSATTQNIDSFEEFDEDDIEDYEDENDFDDEIEEEIEEEHHEEESDLVEESDDDILNFDELTSGENHQEEIKKSEPVKVEEDDDLNLDDLDFGELTEEKKPAVKAAETGEVDPHDIELDELEREIQRQKEQIAEEEKSEVHLELEEELLGIKKPDQEPLVETPAQTSEIASEVLDDLISDTPLEPMPEAPEVDVFQEAPAEELPELPPMQTLVQTQAQAAMEIPSKSNEIFVEQRGIVISEDTIKQTSDSVKKLIDAKNIVSGISSFSQSPMLGELASQLLEPKLEKWLNANLSQLVEKIVREEIKKIIPKE